MNTYRMRISDHVANRLQAHHIARSKRAESISLVLGHAYTSDDGSVTLVLADPEGVLLFADDCYLAREHAHASLRLDVRAAASWHAIRKGYTAIVDVHDHHFTNRAHFSAVDDIDDRQSARFFAETVPRFANPRAPVHAAALLLARGDWAARLVWAPGEHPAFQPMRVDAVGLRLRALSAPAPATPLPWSMRQAAIVPPSLQARLGGMAVAVVGNGGTGSIAAEAVARLGFGRIMLIDADTVEASNLNRLQGTGPADIGQPKCRALANHLRRCCPDTEVVPVQAQAWDESAVQALEQADCVIGCVDNAETRWWLNRYCIQYMVPWFDCAVLIEIDPELRMSARTATVVPGAGPCGHCSPLEFFPRRRPDAFLDRATLAAQRGAGYVAHTAAVATDPSIYPLNLQAVASLSQELIHWLTGHRAVAHSALYESGGYGAADALRDQRIDLSAFGGGAAADCPLCTGTLGRCRDDRLPTTMPSSPTIDLEETAPWPS